MPERRRARRPMPREGGSSEEAAHQVMPRFCLNSLAARATAAVVCDTVPRAQHVQPHGPHARLRALLSAKVPSSTIIEATEREGVNRVAASVTQRTQASYASAVRSWLCFSAACGRDPYPVRSEHVVAWLALFDHPKTARNYVSALKWDCRVKAYPDNWETSRVQGLLTPMGEHYINRVLSAQRDKETGGQAQLTGTNGDNRFLVFERQIQDGRDLNEEQSPQTPPIQSEK
eukprot:Selendium_serpulae@DN9228_c0_g1_i1.p2